jgi:hypothetical protein
VSASSDTFTDKESFEQLWTILSAKKKSELKTLCRRSVVTKPAFANLILASRSDMTPWSHRAEHKQFVPPHLNITEGDKAAVVANGAGPAGRDARRFMNKISAIFEERRLLSGHMFYTEDLSDWHLLYFDQRDTSSRGNHWDEGAHIHLINHLWPNLKAQHVWDQFCSGNPRMKGAYHIRFRDEALVRT